MENKITLEKLKELKEIRKLEYIDVLAPKVLKADPVEWDVDRWMQLQKEMGIAIIDTTHQYPMTPIECFSKIPDSYIIQLTDAQKAKLYANK